MDKSYWEHAYEIRNYLLDCMKHSHLDFQEKSDLTPCYYPALPRISENGGLGLRFLDGTPESLLTPLGEINFIRRKWLPCKEQYDEALMFKLQHSLGLVEVVPPTRAIWGTETVYAITKSPIKGFKSSLPVCELLNTPLSEEEQILLKSKARAMVREVLHIVCA